MIKFVHVYLTSSLIYIYNNQQFNICVSAKKPWQIDYPQNDYFNPIDVARIMMNKKLNLELKNIVHNRNYSKYNVYKVLKNKLHDVNLLEETRNDFLKSIYNRSRERFKRKNISETKKKRHIERGLKKIKLRSIQNNWINYLQHGHLNDSKKRKVFLFEGARDSIIWIEPIIMSNCWLQRMLSEKYEFSPSCNCDGSYQNKQCYLERCWCTDKYGHIKLLRNRFYFGVSAINLNCLN